MKHLRFLARTVLVEKNQLDQALEGLNKVLQSEQVQATARRWEKYERPFEKRNRLSFQKCMEIYSNEIERKVRFIVRKNRENPYPWD
jgi:small subunit ribosomal protein S21